MIVVSDQPDSALYSLDSIMRMPLQAQVFGAAHVIPVLVAEVKRLRGEVAAGIETERSSNATARLLLTKARTELAEVERERDETAANALREVNKISDERDAAEARLAAVRSLGEPRTVAEHRDPWAALGRMHSVREVLALLDAAVPAGTAQPEAHGMIPGSHERADGPECRCGAAWNRSTDRCAAQPDEEQP